MQIPSNRQVVCIDAGVEDRQGLLAGLPDDVEVLLLKGHEDGLQQVAAALEGRSGITALHLICHGAPGKLFLGNRAVGRTALPGYASELAAIAKAMTSDGELLIYGCEVAAEREGRLFIDMLTDITGLKVAAATHKVGAEELGGDWRLNVGMPVAKTLQVAEWGHVLAAPANGIYTFVDAVDNSDGTYTTEDGFFLVSAVCGEVADETDDLVYADGDGASLSVAGPYTTPASPTSYLEVKPTVTGSFILNSADIGETYTDITTDNDYTNIYVVGYANGVEIARTAPYSSVDVLEPSYSFPPDYFTPFADKYIDTIRLYFDTPTGDMADRITLISMDISGASTDPAPTSDTTAVTNTSDTGAGSLRAALAAATTGDTITFATDVAGTITLATDLTVADGVNIDFSGVNSALTITGSKLIFGGNSTAKVGADDTVTIASQITTIANSSLAKTGAGTLNLQSTLNNSAAFAGNLTIQAGKVEQVLDTTYTSGTQALPNKITLDGGTLSHLYNTAFSGVVTVSANGGVIENGNSSYSPTLNGSGPLTVNGALDPYLTDYFGDLFITAGQFFPKTAIAHNSITLTGTGFIYQMGTPSITIADGKTLSSNTTQNSVGNFVIASGGTLSVGPDGAAGKMNIVGNLTIQQGGILSVDIGGTTVGTQYDQINVMDGDPARPGLVDVTNATLQTRFFNGYTPAAGNTFVLINNSLTDAVTGTFNGIAQGGTVTVGSTDLKASYTGGTGNDVTLSFVVPPTLTTIATLTGGTEDTAKTITLADLKSAGNEADTDGTVDAFVVKTLTSGTLTINGTAWAPGTNDIIDATKSASWTPNSNANSTLAGGALAAFEVVAKDNSGEESATPVAVTVTVGAVQDQPYLQNPGVLYSGQYFLNSAGERENVVGSASGKYIPLKDGLLIVYNLKPNVLDSNGDVTTITLNDPDPTVLITEAYHLVSFGENKAMFAASVYHETTGTNPQLILTDGTPGNTQVLTADMGLVNEIGGLVTVGNKAFFLGNTAETGLELWVTDGTSNGTQMVAEIGTGATGGNIFGGSLTPCGNGVFFTAQDANGIYYSDGNTITTLSADLKINTNTQAPIQFGNNVAYITEDVVDGVTTYKLRVTDGTDAGTAAINDFTAKANTQLVTIDIDGGSLLLIKDGTASLSMLYPAYDQSGPIPGQFVVSPLYTPPDGYELFTLFDGTLSDGSIVFSLKNSSTNIYSIWRIGEDDPGLVKDGFAQIGEVYNSKIIDGKLWFTAAESFDSATPYKMWVTDGTAAGTVAVSQEGFSQPPTNIYPWAKVATDNTVKATPFTTLSDTDTADSITGNTIAQLVTKNMIADPDVATAPEAIAITGFNDFGGNGGIWQYKIGSGSWTAINAYNRDGNGNALLSNALLLDATDSVRFVPNEGYLGTIADGITFRAWDKSGSETAGSYVATDGKTGVDGIFSAYTATSSITVADKTAPLLTSAEITGSSLILKYNETLGTLTSDAADFTVKVNGQEVTVSTVAVDQSLWTVTLMLATAVEQADTVTISYADTGTVNPIKNQANLLADNLTNEAVTNNTRPPVTLTELSTLDVVATEDTQQVITFANLAAKGNEAGYQVVFKVTSVNNGSLKIGASAATATAYDSSTNAIIDSTHNAYWTPESNVNGSAVTAFEVVAVDDMGTESNASMPVQLDVSAVNDAPSISFSSGPITTDFNPQTWDQSYRILDAGNGKFVLAGTSGSDDYLTVVRYNADGSLDTSYGTGGKSVIPIVMASFQDATIDTTGNVFVTGKKDQSYETKYVVIKVGATGALDTSFGTEGIATSYLPSEGTARGIAAYDGKIITVARQGGDSPRDFFVERFNANGTEDTTFGSGNGYVSTDLGASEYAYEMAVQSDGKIVLVGGREGDDDEIAIIRYNTDGTLDTSFGGGDGSIVEGSSGTWSSYSAYYYNPVVALQSDGKIVIAANADGDGTLLARYTNSGVLDSSFGTDGKVAIDGSLPISNSYDIKIDANGNIFVLGRGSDFTVAKLTTAGVLDDSFGTNGIARIAIDGYARGSSLVLTSGGKILVTGEYEEPVDGDGVFMVVRLNADGTQDATFGGAKSYELGSAPIALGSGAQITDPDVTDYSGFTITVARDGGANAQDLFADNDDVVTFGADGELFYNSSQIGTYTQSNGTLTLNLGDANFGAIDGDLVNTIAQSITYKNSATSVPANPTIGLKWTVNDGNAANAQGTGAALSGATVQTLTLTPDATAPTLVSSTPADDSTTFGISQNIVLNFSENVLRGTSGNIVIKKTSDNSLIETIAVTDATKVSISSKVVTINPTANLQFSTDYYIEIAGTAFKDAAGNNFAGIADSTTLNFTTTAPQSSASLEVLNPFTPAADDTTTITLKAPDGMNISGFENSAVSNFPKNVKMPLGQFGFNIEGVEVGGTATLSMTADKEFKQFNYFKKSVITGKWVNITEGVTINEDGTATVKFSLKDGGEFDADGIANGVIVDPGGVGENALLPMIAENTTEVGNISLLDENAASGTLSYAITGGADAAKFSINESNGLLSFQSAPNYESPNDVGDTAGNNTYAVQVTVTGSTSGTEVQNLIVTVLNVAEDGDNPNTAPVIIGLRADAQAVTAGTAAVLDDIRVADVDGNSLAVTLTPTNGTIGGLTDADPATPGIQLTGTAAQINAALAGATFTASAVGVAGVSLAVTDVSVVEGGTAITTTAFYAMTAAAAPPPPPVAPPVAPPVTPPETTPTIPPPVELVPVQATVTTETVTVTRTQTDPVTGQQTQVQVQTEQLTVAPVSQGLGSDTKAEVASVPLFWGESSRTEWATTALVPVGVQMQAEGSRAPVSERTPQQVLNELLSMIDQTAPSTDAGKAALLGGGQQFLQDLGSRLETLVVNKITLSAAPQADGTPAVASTTPIVIEGVATAVTVAPGESRAPVEALVIDTRSLPAGSILDLKNIEFAVIVGDNVTVRGGAGANIFYAGAGSQNIKLGADDDVLYAGDGDDWVGSAEGDDRIFGENGNDILFGGTGNDYLDGGSGIDIALFAYNRAEYTLTQQQNGSWIISHAVEGIDTLINIEFAEFADQTISLAGTDAVNQWAHTTLVLF